MAGEFDRNALADARHCPGCKAPGLIPGPMGGNSQNFFCKSCGEGWNLHFHHIVIGVDSIGKYDPKVLEMYDGSAGRNDR